MRKYLRIITWCFLGILLLSIIGIFVIGPEAEYAFFRVHNFFLLWFFIMIFVIEDNKFRLNYLCIIGIILILASGRGLPPM